MNQKNLSLEYLVREPRNKSDKNPLLLLLHGYGSNEKDLFSFAPELPGEYYIVSARAPYDMQYGSYAWYAINYTGDEKKFSDNGQAITSRDLVVDFIGELAENFQIDENDITLVGFSQGSILSYAVALSYPGKVRRIAALSGYLNADILVGNYQNNDFSNLSVFASHGTSDQTIPVTWARKIKPALDALGIKNVYREYPVGHGVAPQNFLDFRDWLEKK